MERRNYLRDFFFSCGWPYAFPAAVAFLGFAIFVAIWDEIDVAVFFALLGLGHLAYGIVDWKREHRDRGTLSD